MEDEMEPNNDKQTDELQNLHHGIGTVMAKLSTAESVSCRVT